jgi:hypothetical protein
MVVINGVWISIFKRKKRSRLDGLTYRTAFSLYSVDGKREVGVLEYSNGEFYLAEQEWVEGTTFKNRHDGRPVGPFASADDAEKFIVATDWFCGRNE